MKKYFKMQCEIIFRKCKTFIRWSLIEDRGHVKFRFLPTLTSTMPKPSPFTSEQERWIVLRYGACHSVTTLHREFRQKFNVVNPRKGCSRRKKRI